MSTNENESQFDDLFDENELAEHATQSTTAVAQPPADTQQPDHTIAAAEAQPFKLTKGCTIVWDIETGPEDTAYLESLFEVDESKIKGLELIGTEFDPATVKLGQMKDAAKINAKIEESRLKFNAALAEAKANVENAKVNQWLEFCERAPLSAVTGKVLAVGLEANGFAILLHMPNEKYNEPGILTQFWHFFRHAINADCRMIGFNIFGFDLPFLVRRSWKLNVDVPGDVLRDGRYWHPVFVDLMRVWGCGNPGERISMDACCNFFGLPGKTGSGADFHKLYHGTADEQKQALDYLRNDLRMTRDVAERMGAA